MSYEKAMKQRNGHLQPILGMGFEGLREGEHIESYFSVASRTATGYNIRVRNTPHEDFEQITGEFETEEQAIIYMQENKIQSQYKWVRVYSTEGMHVSGW